ncbi:MAG: PAS domain S-box protein [Deltaproteobacteria bacterium]|nr:PAS domain S-box protein [Deltaproteobacteria bacterium]
MGGRPDPELAVAAMAAFDHMPVGVMIVAYHPARPPRRVYANLAAARLSGVTLDELRASPPMLRIPAHERVRIEAIARAWLSGAPLIEVFETELETGAGERVPIEIQSAQSQLGDERLLIMFLSDIRARRQADATLRASEALFRRLAEDAPDTIVISVDGIFRYVNPATLRVLGHETVDTILGTPMASILEADEIGVMIDRIRRQHAGEALGPREYRARKRDGTPITIEISATPIMFEGRPAMLAVGRDVEERKRQQAELIRADRMAAVGTLAAGIAHEVNNPLTYVILQLGRLRGAIRKLVPDDAVRADVDAMIADALDGSQRVAHIVRDLLWFAREDASPPSIVMIADPVATAVKLATSALRDRAVVRVDLDGAPAVAANAARLTQVFVNLIVNAAQAFTGERPAAQAIEVTWRPDGRQVVVDVADNGPGLPDVPARIFEPFYTTKAGGTGLGLAISRSIIEDAGGAIEAIARPGGGAILRVRLPRWQGTVVASEAVPEAPKGGSRLLIVDDEPLLADALGRALGEHHACAIARSATEALDQVRAAEWDAIVCDLQLPDRSGLALAREVLAERPRYRGRFVFITGGAMSAAQATEIAALGGAMLAKPFNAGDVEAAVQAMLRGAAR